MESYFDTHQYFSFINGNCRKEHASYVGHTYTDDSLRKHRLRSAFTTTINDWLNEPVVTNGGIMYIEDEQEEGSDEDKYLSYRCYDYIKNKEVIRKFYNDIVQCIKQSKYSFIDINLFKEDFIYYIYKLSDLDSLKNAQKNELLQFR